MNIANSFQPKVKGQSTAMTPAERQRRCRANGKGRHRGGTTAAQRAKARRQWQEENLAKDPELQAALAARTAKYAIASPTKTVADVSAVMIVEPLSISAMAA